jgi:hypothetical protein
MALERTPELGMKAVPLTVKLGHQNTQHKDSLANGLREFYRRGEFADVLLVCAERSFPAHKVVLASASAIFREGLAGRHGDAENGREEVRVAGVENPEAVKIMLDYVYQTDSDVREDYNPRTQDINTDVLRIAQNFALPGLTQRAMHWLAKDITTGNVVGRLSICDDFGLVDLREKILEQLTLNKKALTEVANSPQIMTHPKLMLALLQQAAAVTEDAVVQPKKKAKKT